MTISRPLSISSKRSSYSTKKVGRLPSLSNSITLSQQRAFVGQVSVLRTSPQTDKNQLALEDRRALSAHRSRLSAAPGLYRAWPLEQMSHPHHWRASSMKLGKCQWAWMLSERILVRGLDEGCKSYSRLKIWADLRLLGCRISRSAILECLS